MKVRFSKDVGSSNNIVAELTPTTHPKGGEAWDVTIEGVAVGVLRRWECNEVTSHIGPYSGCFTKRRAVKWSAYRENAPTVGVHRSRVDALWWLHVHGGR